MVFPVAGTVRGHRSPIHGPSNLTPRVPLSASPYHIITTLLTARVPYFSRSLLPSNHYLYPFKATPTRFYPLATTTNTLWPPEELQHVEAPPHFYNKKVTAQRNRVRVLV